MKKIKLLFTISSMDIGGPQKSLLALLDNIDYSKFEVDILVLKPGGALKEHYNNNVNFLETNELITAATIPNENVLKHLIILLKNRKIRMFFSCILSIFKYQVFKKSMGQERQKIWKKYNHQLPNLEKNYDLAFGILGLSTYFIIDLVYSTKKFHWVRSDTRILNRDKLIDEEYYKKLDGSLSVSKECADIFVDMYPFMSDKIEVFYNYIPISFYKKMDYDETLMATEKDTIKILTITRLDPLKGIELAIDACELLIQKGYRIKWFVLGGGNYKKEIIKLIRDKGIENSFILLDFQLNTLSFINDADIFVHPSRTEGKSNAVDEAKYVGKPIVVTNYDTVKEQICNNITGLVCNMEGLEIASSIERILNDSELKNKLITNCKKHRDALNETTSFFYNLL